MSLAGLMVAVAGCTVSGADQPRTDHSMATTPPGVSPEATPIPLTGAKSVRHGPRSKNNVAITLDADYSPAAAARVASGEYPRQVNSSAIDYLSSTGTAATIFVTGMWAEKYQKQLVELAANDSFELANHTYNHDAWTRKCYGLPYVGDDAAKVASLLQTNTAVSELTGKSMAFVRFPGLCHNPTDEQIVNEAGMRSVDADVSTSDAFATNPAAVAKSMLAQVKPGSILVFHLIGPPNAPVTTGILKRVVPMLKRRGLTPVTLSELLAGT